MQLTEKNPLFNKEAVSEISSNAPSEGEQRGRSNIRTYASNVEIYLFCLKKHDLDNNGSFKKRKLSDCITFLMNKGCYGCLQSGHVAQSCRRKKRCKTCKLQNPTSLHGVQPKQTRNSIEEPGNEIGRKEATDPIRKQVLVTSSWADLKVICMSV